MTYLLKKLIYSLLFFCILLAACTLQKRVYRKGFYFHLKDPQTHAPGNIEKKYKKEMVRVEEDSTFKNPIYDDLIASAGNEIFISKTATPIFNDVDCGDSLFLKTGTVYRIKVFDENENEIFYKRCANLQGPLLSINKRI